MSTKNSSNQIELFRQVPNALAAQQFEVLFGDDNRGSGRNRSGIDKSEHAEVSGIVRTPVDVDARFNLRIVRCTGGLVALAVWALVLGIPALAGNFNPCDADGKNCAPKRTWDTGGIGVAVRTD